MARALAVAGLEVVVLGVGDHAKPATARFILAHDAKRGAAGSQTGDAGRSTDVEALVGVAVVGEKVELAADLDLLVRGAGLAKGDRRLVGANELEIVESTLSGIVPAKIELAVAAVERGVGRDLGTPAGKVGVHVEAIRFVALDASLPRLDGGEGINRRGGRGTRLGRRSIAALAGLAIRIDDLGGLVDDVVGTATIAGRSTLSFARGQATRALTLARLAA